MIKKIWHFDLEPNMGQIDRYVRYTVSVALIGAMLLVSPTPVDWLVALPLIAIPVFISAYAGWDPLYALMQKRRTPKFTFLDKKHTALDK